MRGEQPDSLKPRNNADIETDWVIPRGFFSPWNGLAIHIGYGERELIEARA